MQLQVCWISLGSFFFIKYPYRSEGNGRDWKRPQKNCFLLVIYYWCLFSLSFLDQKRKFEKFGPQWTSQVRRGYSNLTSEWSQKIIFRFKHNLRFKNQIHCRWTEHVLNRFWDGLSLAWVTGNIWRAKRLSFRVI